MQLLFIILASIGIIKADTLKVVTTIPELAEIAKERQKRLQKYNFKTNSSQNLEAVEKESALKRQGLRLDNMPSNEAVSKRNLED